jgi:hypothetical protein
LIHFYLVWYDVTRNSTTVGLDDCDATGELLARRRDLLSAGVTLSALGFAGCLGGGGTPTPTSSPTPADEEHEELPEGVSEEAFESGPVPDVYQMALSLGDEERDPDDLTPKADVSFSEFAEAQENDAHVAGTCCANCADYIADKNGDAFGACAEVEGYIDGEDWCTLYEELPEPSVPEGMSEDELATAEVPEAYRTATSQGDEERDPGDLQSQAGVGLTESVEAIAEGTAPPGQSCGNCADFIPDKNGDTWGACAEVEGYIAVEDWCTVWEHVGEEH